MAAPKARASIAGIEDAALEYAELDRKQQTASPAKACKRAAWPSRRHFGFNDIEQILMSVDIELRVDVFDMRLHRVARNRELFLNIKAIAAASEGISTPPSHEVSEARSAMVEHACSSVARDASSILVDCASTTSVTPLMVSMKLKFFRPISAYAANGQERACPLPAARRQGASTTAAFAHTPIAAPAMLPSADTPPPMQWSQPKHAYCARQPRRAPPSQPRKQRVAAREKRRARRIRPWSRNRCLLKPAEALKSAIPAKRSPFTSLPDGGRRCIKGQKANRYDKRNLPEARHPFPKRKRKAKRHAEEEQAHKALRPIARNDEGCVIGDVGWRIGRNLSKHGLSNAARKQ